MRFLLFPLLLGGVCALIAALKKRSILGWFLLGTIFHIFALGILLFLPILPLRPEEVGKSNIYVNCPFCHNSIRLDAWRCPHCRGNVRPIDIEKGKVE